MGPGASPLPACACVQRGHVAQRSRAIASARSVRVPRLRPVGVCAGTLDAGPSLARFFCPVIFSPCVCAVSPAQLQASPFAGVKGGGGRLHGCRSGQGKRGLIVGPAAPACVGLRVRSFTAKNAPFCGPFCMVLLYSLGLPRQGLRAIFCGVCSKVIVGFKSK